MNGPQDLGGMMGFGPVKPEPHEPIFHAAWEKRALAITLGAAALGEWNLDMGRHARESLPPAIYYNASYYEIWTRALAHMLAERHMAFIRRLPPKSPRQRLHRLHRPWHPARPMCGLQKRPRCLR